MNVSANGAPQTRSLNRQRGSAPTLSDVLWKKNKCVRQIDSNFNVFVFIKRWKAAEMAPPTVNDWSWQDNRRRKSFVLYIILQLTPEQTDLGSVLYIITGKYTADVTEFNYRMTVKPL